MNQNKNINSYWKMKDIKIKSLAANMFNLKRNIKIFKLNFNKLMLNWLIY